MEWNLIHEASWNATVSRPIRANQISKNSVKDFDRSSLQVEAGKPRPVPFCGTGQVDHGLEPREFFAEEAPHFRDRGDCECGSSILNS